MRISANTERLSIQEDLFRKDVDVTRVPIEREVAKTPAVRSEGDVTPERLTISDLIRGSSQFEDARLPLAVIRADAGFGVLAGPVPAL